MKSIEAKLQTSCVRWFRLQYPKLSTLLFAVPNGGSRNPIEAIHLKQQGVVAGVSDLILLKPSNGFSSLLIEMKTAKNKQTESQTVFQEAAEKAGNKYIVCRSFDDFVIEINNYLNG